MPSSSNILALIGNTPLVQVHSLNTGPCQLFLKLESQNPGGSIKDRIGRSMIEAAEKEGKIGPGSTLVEATAGNTGLGLALVAAHKGYKLILVIPDKMSQEKVLHLKALGAELFMTRSDVGRGHPAYYQDLAESIARDTPNSFYVNQFNNAANALAHETTTGPEIWEQTAHELHAIVCGVGSGGTITGLSNFFSRIAPEVEFVLADPVGSVLADYVRTGRVGAAGSWVVEGIGEDFVPPLANLSRVTSAYQISDAESLAAARDLLKREGILAGSSTGTLVAAALRYCREQTTAKRVVTFVCDSGNKYLSKMFNDIWMAERGFLSRRSFGDLRDLVARPFSSRQVVSVAPGDTLTTAYTRMRLADVSQLPVLDGASIAGILDESDILLAVAADADAFERPVREFMSAKVQTIAPAAALDELLALLNAGYAGVVAEEQEFFGLITRMDAINFLRRQHEANKGRSHNG